MARRRKNLGSSVIDHRTAVGGYLTNTVTEVKKARIALRMGACLRAGQHIDKAYMTYGAALGNRHGMESSKDSVDGPMEKVWKFLKAIDDEFEPACVRRSPKGDK